MPRSCSLQPWQKGRSKIGEVIDLLTGIQSSVEALEEEYTSLVGKLSKSHEMTNEQSNELRQKARHSLRGILEFLRLYDELVTDLQREELVSLPSKRRPRGGGLSPEELSSILETEAKAPATLDSDAECSICFAGFSEATFVTLPCKHHFHRQCIEQWLIVASSCPLCRHDCRPDLTRAEIVGARMDALSAAVEGIPTKGHVLQHRRPPLPCVCNVSSGAQGIVDRIASCVSSVDIESSEAHLPMPIEAFKELLKRLPAVGEGTCEFDVWGPSSFTATDVTPLHSAPFHAGRLKCGRICALKKGQRVQGTLVISRTSADGTSSDPITNATMLRAMVATPPPAEYVAGQSASSSSACGVPRRRSSTPRAHMFARRVCDLPRSDGPTHARHSARPLSKDRVFKGPSPVAAVAITKPPRPRSIDAFHRPARSVTRADSPSLVTRSLPIAGLSIVRETSASPTTFERERSASLAPRMGYEKTMRH